MSSELPCVYDGELKREQLLDVISDIQTSTQILAVNVKRGRRAHSDEQPVTLRLALAQLLEGDAMSLQVRYLYEERELWTLLRTPRGFRIVRIDYTSTFASQ